MKREDRKRRCTVGRIKCGVGDGSDPAWARHAGPDLRQSCSFFIKSPLHYAQRHANACSQATIWHDARYLRTEPA